MKKLFIALSFLFAFLTSQKGNAQCNATMDYLIYDSTNTIIFYNTGSNGSGYSYVWDFGDSSNQAYTEQVKHKFAKNGTYKVTFYVHNTGKKCSDTLITYVVASGKNPCNAEFTSIQDKSNHWKYTFTAVDTAEENYEWWSPAYSTKKTLTHTFTSGGAYNVILYVTNSKDHCIDTVIKTMNVNKCRANFVYTILNSNLMKYHFFSPEAATKYKWYINGKLLSSKSDTASYSFTSLGYQSACLVIYDSINNCSDSLCKNLNVKKCSAYFGAFVNQGTKTASFTDASSNNITHYYWNFGDGTTLGWGTSSAFKNPTHKYNKAGKYWVTLMTVDSITKCGDSSGMLITVKDCDANFSISSGTMDITKYFFKSAYKGTGINHKWSLDSKTNKDTLTLYFKTQGTYTMCHYITDSAKKCADTICARFTPQGCKAAFSAKADSANKYKIKFTNTSTTASNMKYKWYFGDGKTSTTANPTYTYSTFKSYNVCLEIVDSTTSCKDSTCQTLIAGIAGCDSSFSYKVRNDSLYFAYNGGGTKLKWDYGDGTTDTGKTAGIHVYSKASGYYQVCLTTYCAATNRTSKSCVFILAKNKNCKASFSYKADSANPYKINFTNLSPTSSTAKYLWVTDLGTYTSKNLSLTYSKNGNTNVCLILVDSATSCADSMCKTLYIGNQPCDSSFTYRVSNDSLYFAYTGGGTKTKWDYGDGYIDSGYTHGGYVYKKPGNYTVCLTTYCASTKRTSKYCINITIKSKGCNADFYYIPQSSDSLSNLFISYYSSSKTKHDWHIQGKGAKVNYYDTIFTRFPSLGSYSVCHILKDSANKCSDTVCKTIVIRQKCKALFSIALDTTQKFKLYLINKSSNTSSTLNTWDFGDGNYSGKRNPTHKYSKFGKYNVCLLVYDTTINCYSKYCDTLGLDSSGKLLKADAWELIVLEQNVFGVKKIVKSDFKIYPNPANTKVTIDLSNALNNYQKLEILNSNGQVCITQPIEAGKDMIDIDLEKIARGLYLIKLGNEHGYSYMKLIKN
jgi:PKD repeat protein